MLYLANKHKKVALGQKKKKKNCEKNGKKKKKQEEVYLLQIWLLNFFTRIMCLNA